jgi:NH3-dependent NAD+ synthetase
MTENAKYAARLARLSQKMQLSKTPIPGIMIGLSGTDSILAYVMCYDALAAIGKQSRLEGIHYVSQPDKPDWFVRDIFPWLRQRCPLAALGVAVPLNGREYVSRDKARWADMFLRASGVDETHSYWVSGTANATELALGKYCILQKAVSLQPIATLYKSDVLDVCTALGVPPSAVQNSQIPDCMCGREEFAAENIRLIDDVLRSRIDGKGYTLEQLAGAHNYIAECRKQYDFKTRTPYEI